MPSRALENTQRIATNRFHEGYGSHLHELDAERILFNSQQSELQLIADQLNALVELVKAFGGGWSTKELQVWMQLGNRSDGCREYAYRCTRCVGGAVNAPPSSLRNFEGRCAAP